MSFLDITDPKKRDAIVADYLATVNRIQQRNLNEKAQDLAHSDELKEVFHPVIESTKKSTAAITKELAPLQEEMKNLNASLHNANNSGSSSSSSSGSSRRQHGSSAHNKRWTQDMPITALDYYLQKFNKDKLDKYFGIQVDKGTNKPVMGDREIRVDNNSNIYVDGSILKGTTGLWSLIMLATPRKSFYKDEDLAAYEELIARTRVGRYPRGTERGISRPKSTFKWKKFLSDVNTHSTDDDHGDDDDDDDDDMLQYQSSSEHQQSGGDGIHFLPGDIKGMKTKLRLLLAEFRAGNTVATRNEIVSILDELLRRKQISRKEYTDINKYLSKCL